MEMQPVQVSETLQNILETSYFCWKSSLLIGKYGSFQTFFSSQFQIQHPCNLIGSSQNLTTGIGTFLILGFPVEYQSQTASVEIPALFWK